VGVLSLARRLQQTATIGLAVFLAAGAVDGNGQAAETVAASPSRRSFTLRADWFDRGNAQVSTPGQVYADRFACIWNAGILPNAAEYDVDFPVTADYTLVALYTAAGSRPVDIYVNDKRVHQGFAGVTGSWQTSHARWEKQCTLRVTKGRHTLKLICPGPCMPHVCALRFESPIAFPKTWRLNREAARRRATVAAPRATDGHLIPALPILAEDGDRIEAEVMRAAEYVSAGPAANNELLATPDDAGPGSTPWVARLSIRSDDGPLEEARLDLSPARLRKILDQTLLLIGDFCTMEGVAAEFLEAERRQCLTMQADLTDVLEAPDGQSKWEHFCRVYLAAAQLQHHVASSNPLLDFDRLLLVRRGVGSPALGLPQNWQSNCALPRSGFDDEIALLSPARPGGGLTTFYRPEGPHFTGDVDLDFDAEKLLFSSIGSDGRWHVFEICIDGSGLRRLTPELADVDHYDACYLPDGRIVFSSTAFIAAVPCVNGSTRVANLYRMDADGSNIRQLCFDQEHNWCPTVLGSGRVLYLRWQYTDTPHAHDRLLFSMNPDGTGQMEYYGANSYWPNSNFYARPIPGHPTRFVGVVGGHHGVPRMGELVLFDLAQGRREATGAIQRIPGRGKPVTSATDPRYESTLIADNLVDASWPKFLHPYPLNEKYFLVACKPTPASLWGIYLADVFDNMLLLKEEPGYALLEPIPVRATPRPPVIPDRVDLTRKDAVVYLSDVYRGDGLKGIPRGTVKRLRLLSYHYLYPGMGGPQGVVGMEGPWDIKRVLGTVPVAEDGSAVFRVPANTPIAVQPLDAEGKALQLMRSWFTAMPGEVLSCVGCHEGQNSGPPPRDAPVATRPPAEIVPWYGPVRGFNFQREVQPVLDEYCVGCHDGRSSEGTHVAFDLRGTQKITGYTSLFHFGAHDAGHFSTSYAELHRFVRRPGLESDAHMLMPMEYHADTAQLVQLLARGHYNVKLDAEAWDRLVTWIDLNAPYHGTWTEIAGAERVRPLAERRRELLRRYGGIDVDFEAIPTSYSEDIEPIVPDPVSRETAPIPLVHGWPFDAAEAKRRQAALGQYEETIELPGGLELQLVLIPPGEFVMGDVNGDADERPACRVKIDEPFWIGRFEVTNEQFAAFDPAHDSRVESKHAMQFGVRGFYVNGPQQPVVRVSWRQAVAFCRWLSEQTGRRFTLPTEAHWEYACRAGSDSPFYYGDLDTDFSPLANLADAMLSEFVCHPYQKRRNPFANPGKYDDWIPKDARYRDGGFVSEAVGRYQPNVWGLCDVHGNVGEWTRSTYRLYPYRADDGRNDPAADGDRVVRGGSWRDRPCRSRSASRLPYRPYQGVYNVGLRVVCAVGTEP